MRRALVPRTHQRVRRENTEKTEITEQTEIIRDAQTFPFVQLFPSFPYSLALLDHLINGRKISSLRAISSLVMSLKRGGIIAREVASRAATSS